MNNLKQLRKEKGIKQAQLSVAAKVSQSILVNTEKWGYTPSEETKGRIAKALGVSVDAVWPAETE